MGFNPTSNPSPKASAGNLSVASSSTLQYLQFREPSPPSFQYPAPNEPLCLLISFRLIFAGNPSFLPFGSLLSHILFNTHHFFHLELRMHRSTLARARVLIGKELNFLKCSPAPR